MRCGEAVRHARGRPRTVGRRVGPVTEFIEDTTWLFGEVDLKADVVDDVVCLVGSAMDTATEWNDGDEIDKGLTAFSVVDEACLALFTGCECLAHVGYGIAQGRLAGLAFGEMTCW